MQALLRSITGRQPPRAPVPHRGALILALGFFALMAQTLLIRAFLTVFEGHELAIGCFFGSWFLWVAVGAGLGRWVSGWFSDPLLMRTFALLALLYLPAYAIEYVLITSARSLIHVTSFEVFPFGSMVVLSLVANASVSLVTGFLFTLACRWWAPATTVTSTETTVDPAAAIANPLPAARVFVLETLGATAGGVAVTVLLANGMLPFHIVLAGAVVLCVAVSLAWPVRPWLRALPTLLGLGLLLSPIGNVWTTYDATRQWSRLLPGEAYRGRFATAQADYLYGEHEGQFEVVSAGGVCESIPDRAHGVEVAALGLSQCPQARRVLVIGPGSLSVALALAELPDLESITWLHPDPDYPGALTRVLPRTYRERLARLTIPAVDIRQALDQPGPRSDLAILHLPDVTTLVQNRCFALGFLRELKKHLAPDAVVALRVAGSANYPGPEQSLLGASAVATLHSLWPHVALKPGEESWLFASGRDQVLESPARLRDRWAAIPGAAALFPPDALVSLYPPDRIALQRQKYHETMAAAGGTKALVNTDDRPLALLFTLLLTLRQGGFTGLSSALPVVLQGGAWIVAALLGLYALLRLVYVIQAGPSRSSGAVHARDPRVFDGVVLVLATGLAGMSLSIVLMFSFQARFGTLFLHVGLVSALFMLGAFGGSLFAERFLRRSAREPRALLPLVLSSHLLFLAMVATLWPATGSRLVYAALFGLAGVFTGVYFPLAALRLRRAGWSNAGTGATLEALDHLGAAAGAMLTGLFLLPVLGTSTTIGLLGGLVAVNLVPAVFPGRMAAGATQGDRALRPLGYVLFGVGVWMLVTMNLVAHLRHQETDRQLEDIARSLLESDEIVLQEVHMPDGRTVPCVKGPDRSPTPKQGSSDEPDDDQGRNAFVFSSADLAPDVRGYQGPITLAVRMDSRGVLQDYAILHSRETPAYLAMVQPLRARLLGRSVLESGPWQGVDVVSGATLTSRAIVATLRQSGRAFAKHGLGLPVDTPRAAPTVPVVEGNVLWLAGFLLVAAVLRFRPGRWTRRSFLLLSLVILGFGLNLQFSTQHVFSLLDLGWPEVTASATFALVVGVPVLTLLIGNVYCGYVCPFGALQELAGELRPRRWVTDPTRTVWRYGRFVKYVLLFWLVALFALTHDFRVLSPDPLITVFGTGRTTTAIFWAGVVVVLSIPFRRFWCRNLCPAGAFLALLGRVRILRPLSPEPRIGSCDLGVRTRRELDCLRCDRCRHDPA